MPPPRSIVHHVSKWVLLISLICAALLSIAGRVLLANVDAFKQQIEQELADYGITGVSLENVAGSWSGLHPVLKIQGASLSIPGRSQALSIDEMSVNVKLIPSLINADLQLEAFNAAVTKLILVHDHDGTWWLNDIPLNAAQDQTDSRIDIYEFFQRLPDFVSIQINLLQIRDLLNDVDHLVQRTSLRSSRRDQQLTVSLAARLPATLGRDVTLLLQGDEARQQLYLKAEGLNLVQLLQLAGQATPGIERAGLALESWAKLENFQPVEITNRARLRRLVINVAEHKSQPIRFAVRQKIQPVGNGWRVDSLLQDAFYGDQPLGELQTQLLLDRSWQGPALWVKSVQLGRFHNLVHDLLANDELRQVWQGTHPEMQLENLVARINLKDFSRSRLGFRFDRLQGRPHGSIPGIDSLSGIAVADQGTLHLQIDPAPLTVTFARLFRDPLVFDRVAGAFEVTARDSTVLVATDSVEVSNADINARARAWLEASPGQRPFLSLRANYGDGKAAATSRYLPVGIMPQGTVDWLDRAIKGGTIPQGDLLFHGRVNNLSVLQREMAGEFHALFDVQNPRVEFLPDWPTAHQGTGRASFHNLAMKLDFTNVNLASSTVEQVQVGIDDLLRPELIVDTRDESAAAPLLETLAALPVLDLAKQIRRRSEKPGGKVDSELQLRIPLQRGVRKRWGLQAKAKLREVDLTIPSWMVDLQQVNGDLIIEDTRVSAKGLQGKYAGDPGTIDIIGRDTNTEFRLRGGFDARALTRLLPSYLAEPVSGTSPWDIRVTVAHRPGRNDPRVKVAANSTLTGTELGYPQPFRLAAADAASFRFDGALNDRRDLDFSVALADRIHANGHLTDLDGPATKLAHLNVAFNTQPTLQNGPGVRLAGQIDRVDMTQWDAYTDAYFESSDNANAIHRHLQTVDLRIDQLSWGGQEIYDASINVLNNGALLLGQVNSSLASGTFQIPFDMDETHPLSAQLDYLRLHKPRGKVERKPGFEDMPNLVITSKLASFEDMDVADFILRTSNTSNRFSIHQLDFTRDQVSLKSSGHWQYDEAIDEHVTVFNLQIKGGQFGKTLEGLGLSNSIRDGSIDFEGQIGWGGTLFDINWPTLIGEVSLKLEDGYLNNIEPGAGRFVGLLSLSALPKRLFLDFGDVLSEGMQFDEIQGRFSIKGEIMTTDDATMRGASARVKLVGETNLREQTYDQSMLIVPQVGDTLPVLGSLAAGNAVGWGLLLIQRIFKKPIDKSVEIEYRISGSWDDPEIELITKPEEISNQQDLDDIFNESN